MERLDHRYKIQNLYTINTLKQYVSKLYTPVRLDIPKLK